MAAASSVDTAAAALSEEKLVALLRARPDLAVPAPANSAELARRAADSYSVGACIETLDRGARQVVDALCLLPRPTTTGALVDLLGKGVALDSVETVLDRLVELVLVVRTGEELDLNPGIGPGGVTGYPAGLGPPLQVALASQPVHALAEVAHRVGAPTGPNKAATLAILVQALSEPAGLRRLIVGGPAGTDVMARRLAAGPPVVTGQGGFYSVNDKSPIGWMLRRGLLALRTWDSVVMPREVGLVLRGGRPFDPPQLDPPQVATTALDVAGADREGAEAAVILVDGLAEMLDAWGCEPPRMLRDGGVGVREVRRTAKLLDRTERDAAIIIELAGMVGLVGIAREGDVALPVAAYDDWVRLEPGPRWAWLVRRWLDCPFDASVAGAQGRDKAIPPLLDSVPDQLAVVRRGLVVRVLADLPPGAGAQTEALAGRADWLRPGAWVSGPAPPALLAPWLLHEAALLGVAVGGALTTAGRLAVAGRDEEAASALSAAVGPEGTELVFQADLTALAPGRLTAEVRSEMELLADVESSGAATVFRLSEATLRRAFDAGRSADDISSFLRGHAARGLPQTIDYLVTDLGRRHGNLRVGAARCFVRSEDESLVAEVLAGRRTSRLGLRRLAPTVLVSDKDPQLVVDGLRGAGYLPAREDAGGELVVTARQRRRAPRALHPYEPDKGDRPAAAPMGFDPEALLALVAGPQRGRDLAAVVRAATRGKAPAPPPEDAASIAARLCRPPPRTARPVAKVASKLPQPVPAPQPSRQPALWSGGPVRPAAIVKDPEALIELFQQARVEEWVVRLAYVNGKGREAQLNAVALEVADEQVLVQCLPRLDLRTLNVGRIGWARVMTEAEEDQLL